MPSNNVKMGEALSFAAVAGAVQVAESEAERQARNQRPIAHASGVNVTPGCDDQDQYACATIASSPAPRPPEREMTDDEARDYVLGYVNGVRKLNGQPPVAHDDALDKFARDGSEQLATEHRTGQHLADHPRDFHVPVGEVQGAPAGAPPGPLQDRLGEALLQMMNEGAGGMHHDVLLRPEWRKLGVGVVERADRLYLTMDFSG
jgi:uncharacterized protein YkwD